MIRVMLPAHLRKLAHVDGEVSLEVAGQITQDRFSTRSKRGIQCCVARFETTSLQSAALS